VPEAEKAIELTPQDRWEIQDILVRYCLGLDRRDFDMLASIMIADAVADYGAGDGTVDMVVHGRAEILKLLRVAVAQWDRTHHLCGAALVEATPGGAHAQCYVQAQHMRDGTPNGDWYIRASVYMNDMVRTPDGWRIARRAIHRDTVAKWGNPEVVNTLYAAVGDGYGV
jgi:hypothetical protein